MKKKEISKAALGRIPTYLKYLRNLSWEVRTISAAQIARELGLGEVQVRKDLCAICGAGKPKVGYATHQLMDALECFLHDDPGGTIVIGAGRLGRALLDCGGFEGFGLDIQAAFDNSILSEESSEQGKPILPMEALADYCRTHQVNIGVIAVPAPAAQEVCNTLYALGIRAMWCFAPCKLYKPADAVIEYENMALSLAYLRMQIRA